MTNTHLSNREVCTVLAALRAWQRAARNKRITKAQAKALVELASLAGAPLSDEEIDELCERLQAGPLDQKPPTDGRP